MLNLDIRDTPGLSRFVSWDEQRLEDSNNKVHLDFSLYLCLGETPLLIPLINISGLPVSAVQQTAARILFESLYE